MVVCRILVTGSRSWTDRAVIRAALAEVWHPGTMLVSGACPGGADALCEACWSRWGGPVERHPAHWRPNGSFDRAAGFRRNAAMVAEGADLCLAFIRDKSAGATHTARLAWQAGIRTRIYRATTGTSSVTRHDYWRTPDLLASHTRPGAQMPGAGTTRSVELVRQAG